MSAPEMLGAAIAVALGLLAVVFTVCITLVIISATRTTLREQKAKRRDRR